MAAILAQKIALTTAQDEKLVRAVLRQLVQRGEGEPTWEDAGDLPIGEDGSSFSVPTPGNVFKDEEEEET